jgi:FkbM family methyltransferase
MHNGDDTDFYLRKGFRVVAVEANPALVELAKQRFRNEISAGHLTVIGKAIAEKPGLVELWINDKNDEWSSLSQQYVDRNDRIGAKSKPASVPSVDIGGLLEAHGIPYYLKIDIEGLDHLCINALHDFSNRPKYVSVETSGTNDFVYTRDLIDELYVLGYRKFKLLNQYMNRSIRLPNPPREGVYVDHRFEGLASSGPFGEETPGDWESAEQVIAKYEKVLPLQAKHTIQAEKFRPILSMLYYRLHDLFRLEPVGWYDIHAKFEAGDSD